MEDNVLINQVLKGNKNAYKLLVIRYQRPLFSFLRKFGFSAQRTEELAQDVFLKSYQYLTNFDSEKGSFSVWIFSIAKHHAINELKKKNEWLESEETIEQIALDNSDVEGLERVVGKKLKALNLNDHVQKVPNPFKVPLILSYIQELSLDEIAHIEKCSIGTVKSRIHRGKVFLKSLLISEDFI